MLTKAFDRSILETFPFFLENKQNETENFLFPPLWIATKRNFHMEFHS